MDTVIEIKNITKIYNLYNKPSDRLKEALFSRKSRHTEFAALNDTKISNFATEESLQFILNVLFSCYFAKNYQDNNKFKLQNSKILEKQRLAVLSSMKDEK